MKSVTCCRILVSIRNFKVPLQPVYFDKLFLWQTFSDNCQLGFLFTVKCSLLWSSLTINLKRILMKFSQPVNFNFNVLLIKFTTFVQVLTKFQHTHKPCFSSQPFIYFQVHWSIFPTGRHDTCEDEFTVKNFKLITWMEQNYKVVGITKTARFVLERFHMHVHRESKKIILDQGKNFGRVDEEIYELSEFSHVLNLVWKRFFIQFYSFSSKGWRL